MVVLEPDQEKARAMARQGMAIYLRAPNYTNNLKRLGFTDADFEDGGSDRLVDAIVCIGDVAAVRDRVDAHFAAGASHVCVQVLGQNMTDVPEAAWGDLAAALLS
jgi:probable F420-dependent oxidoreductase